jgi:hypothetical protein
MRFSRFGLGESTRVLKAGLALKVADDAVGCARESDLITGDTDALIVLLPSGTGVECDSEGDPMKIDCPRGVINGITLRCILGVRV